MMVMEHHRLQLYLIKMKIFYLVYIVDIMMAMERHQLQIYLIKMKILILIYMGLL